MTIRPCLTLGLLICSLMAGHLFAAPLPGAAPGDLIFREGTAPVSDVVISVDEGRFSHVGMLARRDGAWEVIHATPSERAGRPDGVVIDALNFFIAPARARHWQVYHVANATSAQRAQAVRWARAQTGTPFDVLGTTGTYCTTLVWAAWQQAGLDLQARFTRLHIPLAQGDFLLPSGLLASPLLSPLLSAPEHDSTAETALSR
ncbi:YiiX/YebB-like N1pC/P60 family cysteine hydrolase [Salinicola avicenniae]|uniref:YiiX/YebB-like N1pC/P60 family cysteine hydrolase n=1 Tax=Salinicola avicenniae TaxID=2916836 RepID=UPI002072E49B|nr:MULTISPECIES: YiiX/YebB-like N1pC/P60 family cysteine hydrolase [unclassified Salinicola]